MVRNLRMNGIAIVRVPAEYLFSDASAHLSLRAQAALLVSRARKVPRTSSQQRHRQAPTKHCRGGGTEKSVDLVYYVMPRNISQVQTAVR